MSARKIFGIIIIALAFAMPQSGAYASSLTERFVKKIAEKDPLFYGFSDDLNHVCAAEKQAILEFTDSGESAVVENFARQATICLEKLENEFFGETEFDDWNSDNSQLLRRYRDYYCIEARNHSFVMAVDSDFQSQLKMMYDKNCRVMNDFIDSADLCSIRLRKHFKGLVQVKTILGGLEVAEIAEKGKRLYSDGSPARLQQIHGEQRYKVLSQCARISNLSIYGFDNLALLFEFRKKNRDAYLGYAQEYLNANCDAKKTCRIEIFTNVRLDSQYFYGPVEQKDLEIFAMSSQALRGDDRILPAARAAIAELEATRKADIDDILAEYTLTLK